MSTSNSKCGERESEWKKGEKTKISNEKKQQRKSKSQTWCNILSRFVSFDHTKWHALLRKRTKLKTVADDAIAVAVAVAAAMLTTDFTWKYVNHHKYSDYTILDAVFVNLDDASDEFSMANNAS